MQAPKIVIQNLNKIFYNNILDAFSEQSKAKKNKSLSPKDKIAIDNLSIEFNSGESIGIVGKNGAGKSTLLSIIAGLAQQSSGQIIVNGKVTTVMTLGVGLREDLSGRENIYLDGELQGKSRDEIDVCIDEIIEFSELNEFIDKPVKFYSTGMKSRLAFSMLVCIEPEILIIDEALSAGDVFFGEKASKKIREICSIGKIVIIVSHSMGAIMSLCNRCLWMDGGKIIQDGDPKIVTEAYLKKVQEEDSSIQISLSQKELSETIGSAQYKIKDVVTKLRGANYPQRVFYTDDSFVIEIQIQRGTSRNAVLSFCTERLDETVIDLQTFHLSKHPYSEVESEFVIELSLDPLILNRGYYKFKIDLIENDLPTNQFTRFIEVKNNKIAAGGYSLLYYPAQIKIINEELRTCSDLKELIFN